MNLCSDNQLLDEAHDWPLVTTPKLHIYLMFPPWLDICVSLEWQKCECTIRLSRRNKEGRYSGPSAQFTCLWEAMSGKRFFAGTKRSFVTWLWLEERGFVYDFFYSINTNCFAKCQQDLVNWIQGSKFIANVPMWDLEKLLFYNKVCVTDQKKLIEKIQNGHFISKLHYF